jgi:ABC-2 type transport system ATP-binding protein
VSAIEIHNLTKRFGPVTAVDNVSFSVDHGSVVGFLGPNGAGKTTTLRMLLGLVAPTSGVAHINDRPYRDTPNPSRVVGAVLESSNPYPGRTARNHLRIQATVARIPLARVDEVLDLVDLTGAGNRRVGQFSLGMRQRLGLAAALLGDPEVLILDEPANGLDPEGVRWLRSLLQRLAAEGRTVLVSSHILAEVAQTVDTVVILDNGRLITHSTLTELISSGGDSLAIRTPRPADLSAALLADGAAIQSTKGNWLTVTGATAEQIGTLAAAHGIPIFETNRHAPDLEDVFLRLTTETSSRPVNS